jgi:LuxR family transcriptional regulator, maltose regulon positive regulatory protein
MCGPLCDAVLATRGSGEVLASLEDSNLPLAPLDRRREWYRYHQLFRELLLAELERREPDLVGELHARAAVWCEANQLPEIAIDHAQAAGGPDRVAGSWPAWCSVPMPAGGSARSIGGWPGSRNRGPGSRNRD